MLLIGIASLKQVGTLVFFILFVGIAVRLLVTRKGHYDRDAQMPLDDAKVLRPRNSKVEGGNQ